MEGLLKIASGTTYPLFLCKESLSVNRLILELFHLRETSLTLNHCYLGIFCVLQLSLIPAKEWNFLKNWSWSYRGMFLPLRQEGKVDN